MWRIGLIRMNCKKLLCYYTALIFNLRLVSIEFTFYFNSYFLGQYKTFVTLFFHFDMETFLNFFSQHFCSPSQHFCSPSQHLCSPSQHFCSPSHIFARPANILALVSNILARAANIFDRLANILLA